MCTFLYGISPGGGLSNFVAFYTDSNLELSIALSTISNVLAFGLMPLWILAWPLIAPEDRGDEGTVPFIELLKTLGLLVGPLIGGLIIRYFAPKPSAKAAKFVSPSKF